MSASGFESPRDPISFANSEASDALFWLLVGKIECRRSMNTSSDLCSHGETGTAGSTGRGRKERWGTLPYLLKVPIIVFSLWTLTQFKRVCNSRYTCWEEL